MAKTMVLRPVGWSGRVKGVPLWETNAGALALALASRTYENSLSAAALTSFMMASIPFPNVSMSLLL